MRYDYIKYPEDRIYLRLGLLINDIISNLNGDIEAYAYVNTIKRSVSPDSTDKNIKTEKFILSPGFINQKVFTGNRNNIKNIIRNYKLEMIL
jgi:hypothetical protein